MLVLAEPVNGLVRERWDRALRLGLQRDSDAYPIGTSGADLIARRERLEDVFRDEREILNPISAQLATGPLVAIVADRDGVILSARADRHQLDSLARVRLVEGARWSEDARGTNAIGTALVEGTPVAVVGRAHFEVRNRGLFCYAAPIRDAFGDVVAVLDVTGPIERNDPSIGIAVQAAGLAVERSLRTIAYGDRRSGALSAIERLVQRSSTPTMLIEASGIVRLVNAAARTALPLKGENLTCTRVFGVSFAELVPLAAARGGMRFETSTGAFRLALDPIAGPGARTLAVIVHFEAERTSVAPTSQSSHAFTQILGEDRGVVEAKSLATRFAATELPVLLLAETGTGKELFARAIHGASGRRDRPFVAINCGALSPSLIASELFGYAPGAFTGAQRNGSEGRIHAASGGTLFLDEIAEIPEALQAALLRVLDDGVYQRVGEARDRRADFRLVCATCRDLPALVASGSFRNDLFYRIQGACVTIPALRDRSDRVWLAERLLEQQCAGTVPMLSESAERFIDEHDWPGNVRELKSAMAHALALANGARVIERAHLPKPLIVGPAQRSASTTRKGIVRDAIDAALRASEGNVSEAARKLGVGRNTIYRALKDSKGD